MKNAAINENPERPQPAEDDTPEQVHSLQQQVEHYKKESDILLALSNDITRVREKNDLIRIFSSRLKKFFQFAHAVIGLIDKKNKVYYPFLLETEAHPARGHIDFNAVINKKYPIDDSFIERVLNSSSQITIKLEDVINEPAIPGFIKMNHQFGIKSALITPLKNKMELFGYVYISSDQTDSFPDDFKSILQGIAPHLSSAVTNIIINEEIAQREEEKSILLFLSNDIAALKNRGDLLQVVNTRIKALFSIQDFGFMQINKDQTYSTFMLDLGDHIKKQADYTEITSGRYSTGDPVFTQMMKSEEPVLFDVNKLAEKPGMPKYVSFWKKIGLKKVLGTALRVGGENIGCAFLHIDDNRTGEIKNNLLKAVFAQLSVAVSNILANEQIIKKHEEQTFLLDFSNDIAQVRTRAELQAAIFKVLDKTMHTQLAMIRVIEDDDFHLYPFMFDSSLFEKAKIDFTELAAERININESYTARVLASKDGLVFNVDEELKGGNAYARLWKTTGLKNMYSLPLRVGNKNLGTIWLLANRLSTSVLKGICSQISIAIANIQANEKLLAHKKQLEGENDYLREQIKTIYNFSDIIGDGPQMQKVYHLMSLVAGSGSTVLLLGETGTGKELIARAIHNSSPRKNKLMVKVNCAALPPNLIESELFGHEKGAFTGAIERRIGKFELANNSTIFLDEIGEMPLETQVKLLRVLQERELERVGGKTTIKVDVRIIAATNRNLENEVRAGRFRSDLYYRLNVFPITLPPLRDRPEDIVPLADFFLARYSKNSGKNVTSISPKCIEELKSYSWPGNVRELEHLIERGILLTQGNILTEIQLPRNLNEQANNKQDLSNKTLQQLERDYIIEVLKRCSGKISGKGGAAAALEIPSTTLHSKMKKLGISKADYFQNQD